MINSKLLKELQAAQRGRDPGKRFGFSSFSPTNSHCNIWTILETALAQSQSSNDMNAQATIYETARVFATESNHPQARAWLAQCLLFGHGVHQNVDTAYCCLKAMANQGIQEAYYPLGCCYYDGLGVAQDKTKALMLMKKSDNPMAMYQVGSMLSRGVGSSVDEEEALNWFQKSAIANQKYAQFILGMHYEHGFVVEKNWELAKKYYFLSANQGFSEAEISLGSLLLDQGKSTDGLHWIYKACEKVNYWQ
jgi:TPR repeat protein